MELNNSFKLEDISDEETTFNPPDVNEPLKGTFHQLPLKSKLTYEKIYKKFLNWCSTENVNSYTEEILLKYFTDESQHYKASSLWSHYSMIKACLEAKDQIDISGYRRLLEFLKHKMQGYIPKKSKVFNKEQIMHFISEAPDDLFLAVKVGLIFGISGACRREEMSNLSVDDIEDLGSALIVNIRSTPQKIDRVFTVVDSKENSIKFLDVIRKYACLRPPHTPHRRFFLSYRQGKCSTQVMGKNTFGTLPGKVAAYLELPDPQLYTGHCFRQSSIAAVSGKSKRKAYGNEVWQCPTFTEQLQTVLFDEDTTTSISSQLVKNDLTESEEEISFLDRTHFTSVSKSCETKATTEGYKNEKVVSSEKSSLSCNSTKYNHITSNPSITIKTVQIPQQTASQHNIIDRTTQSSIPQITIKTFQSKGCEVLADQKDNSSKSTTNVNVICHQESSSEMTIKTIPFGVVISGCNTCNIELHVK